MTSDVGVEPPAFHRFQIGKLKGEMDLISGQWELQAPLAVVECDGFDDSAWTHATPDNVLAIRLSGAPVRYCWGPNGATTSARGNLALITRGAPNHFLATERVRFANIYLPDRLLDRCADVLKPGCKMSGRLRPDLIFNASADFERRALEYVDAAMRRSTTLEMEARAILLVESLLCRHHALAPLSKRPVSGGLAPWQVRRTIEYLRAHFDSKVSVETLARLVNLSPFHFARAFKQSVGKPPHAYQSDLRLGAAKRLLLETDQSISEVALAIGYEAPQTLARVFQREVGMTPTAYRREQKR